MTCACILASRIHVKITDTNTVRYEVPESVLPRPSANNNISLSDAQIKFNYTASPFSFTIYRTSTEEVLFSTASHPIIFEPQYLRLKTSLPLSANIYGLGEHTDSFRLDPTNTTRTFWSRDAYGVPTDTNLYGNHPVYFEHRTTGTHGVFLLNSNGMDIKIVEDGESGSLEYNTIGGVLDFYFLAGSETDPTEVARQYAEVVGTPAEVPYWSFGLHQCRFGYQSELSYFVSWRHGWQLDVYMVLTLTLTCVARRLHRCGGCDHELFCSWDPAGDNVDRHR